MADIRVRKRCWAQSLGNCEGPLTKEHVVSESILKLFNPVKFNQKTAPPIHLGKGSFVLRVLCRKHNTLLSEYDSEALKLFKAVSTIPRKSGLSKVFEERDNHHELILSKSKIERWYAKTFLNYVAFSAIMFESESQPFHLSPHSLLEKLYGDEQFDSPFGLYVVDDKPIKTFNSGFHIAPDEGITMRIVSKEGKISNNYKFPCFLYTNLLGIELIGVFNVTTLSDDNATKPLTERLNSLNRKLTKDFKAIQLDSSSTELKTGQCKILFE